MNNLKKNEKPGLTPHERRILAVTAYGHFMSHFNMLVFPAVVLPLTTLLDMPMGQVLGLSFYMYLLFGVTALPWGIVADRYGAKKLLSVFYLGAGLAGIAAAIWIDKPSALMASLAFIGLFSGIYHPAGLGLISKEVSRISVAMGINGMFGNLGLALAPLLTGLVNFFWGPRAAYLVLGGLNLIGVILILLFPLTESTEKVERAGAGNGHLKAFLILLIAMMLGGIVYRGATVITPAYFEIKNHEIFAWLSSFSRGGLSENLVATTVTSAIFLIGMLGQYMGGQLAERYQPRYIYLIFHGITIPISVLMALFSNVSLVILAMVYFIFLLGMQPAENTLVATYTPRRLHHAAFGTKFVLTFGVGSLAVKMVEFIQTAFRIEAVFLTLAVISSILVLSIMFLIHNTKNSL